MKLSVFVAVVVATAVLLLAPPGAAQTVASGAKKPCSTSGGVAITLNGNFGFCYLKGRRMRPGSVFAQCQDGKITCFEDEGIPDKPRKAVPCIAPEPGFCGSDKNATPAPVPTAANGSRLYEVGENEEGELELDGEEADRDMDAKPKINPSALVAGNLANGESYEDDEADDAVYR